MAQKDLKNVGNKVCLNLIIQERHYISALTVLTLLPKIHVICSVIFALTLERSHMHVKCVGGALLNLHIAINICTEYILQPEIRQSAKASHTLERNHTRAKHVGGVLLNVEV